MIDNNLYRKPVVLQRDLHRDLRWASLTPDLKNVAQTHSMFIAAAEMGDVCLEMPIVFTHAGKTADGQDEVAPVAVLGLKAGENLMLDAAGQWRSRYLPMMMRVHPLAIARDVSATGDQQSYVMCVDEESSRLSREDGEPLFDEQGEPSKFLRDMREHLEQFEIEIERTRYVGRRLLELGLLENKRFDATMPDGEQVMVDGFMAISETRMAQLTDAQAGQLTRDGLMYVIHAQLISMRHMVGLVERRFALKSATPDATA